MDEVRRIFPQAEAGKDRKSIELDFDHHHIRRIGNALLRGDNLSLLKLAPEMLGDLTLNCLFYLELSGTVDFQGITVAGDVVWCTVPIPVPQLPSGQMRSTRISLSARACTEKRERKPRLRLISISPCAPHFP